MIDVFYLFVLSLVVALISSILLIMIVLKTPAFTWLMASMGGKSLIFNFRKDKTLEIRSVKYKAGMAVSKKDGIFLVTPSSNYREKGTGVNVMALSSETGVGMPIEYYQLANKMKADGIDEFEIADQINEQIKKDTENDPDGKKALIYKIPTYITVGFDSLKNFFYYNLNAASLQYLLEKKMAEELQKHRDGSQYKWIPYIAVLLVAAAIAVFIIYGVFFKTGSIDASALAARLPGG